MRNEVGYSIREELATRIKLFVIPLHRGRESLRSLEKNGNIDRLTLEVIWFAICSSVVRRFLITAELLPRTVAWIRAMLTDRFCRSTIFCLRWPRLRFTLRTQASKQAV